MFWQIIINFLFLSSTITFNKLMDCKKLRQFHFLHEFILLYHPNITFKFYLHNKQKNYLVTWSLIFIHYMYSFYFFHFGDHKSDKLNVASFYILILNRN